MYKLSCLVFTVILIVGCQPEVSQSKKLAPVEKHEHSRIDIPVNNSFFVTAAKLDEEKLMVENGMGVLICATDEKSWILLTCYHIVKNAHSITIMQWSGKSQKDLKYDAELVGFGPELDIALLSFESEKTLQTAKLNSTSPEIGSELIVFGQPAKMLGAISKGIVSGFWPLPELGTLIISDVVTTKGFSGGGVFDMNSHLIGMAMGKTADEKRGFTYILPIDKIFPLTNGFGFDIGRVQPPKTGISKTDANM